MSEAMAVAEEIAAGPAAMLTMSKVMMKRAYEASVEDFFEREAVAQAIAFGKRGVQRGRRRVPGQAQAAVQRLSWGGQHRQPHPSRFALR